MKNQFLIDKVLKFRKDFGIFQYNDNGHRYSDCLPYELQGRYYSFVSFVPDFIYDPQAFDVQDSMAAFLYFCRYNNLVGHYSPSGFMCTISGIFKTDYISIFDFERALSRLSDPNPVYILTLAEKLRPRLFENPEIIQASLL